MKKILIIATTPFMHDGLTRVILETIDRADRTQAQLYLVPGMGFTHEFEREIRERNIPFFPVPNRAYDPLHYYPALIKVLRSEKYDAVHIHGNSATMAFDLLLAALAGIPVRISHIHNTATNHPALHAAVKPLLNAVVTDPAACSVPAGKWLYTKPFTLVKNGIDPERFAFDAEARERVRRELGLSDALVIGHVGRFRRQKNHEFLLEIFDEIAGRRPDAVLLLIGEGELLEEIREKVRTTGLAEKVIFCGTTDRISDYYMAMDVFLLPSLYEGLGIAAVEAQAAALPAVLSDEVPEEAVFEENVKRLPLSESAAVWAETVIGNAGGERGDRREDVRRAGYDAADLTRTLDALWHLPEKGPSGLRISVVMAVHNGMKYLAEQLDSVRAQTCPPEEVIISDDGSSDGSAEFISSYIKQYGLSGWRLVRQEKALGAGGNFAAALAEASGDIIFLADQDDVWLPEKIGTMTAAFSDPGVSLAVSSIRYMDGSGREKHIKTQLSCRRDHEVSLAESLAVCSYLGMSMAFRREVFERADRTLWEKSSHDWALLLSAHALGRVLFLGKACQFYRQHEDNASGIRGGSRKERRLNLIGRQRQHVHCAAECAKTAEAGRAAEGAERFLAVRERLVREGRTAGLLRMCFLYGKHGYTARTFAADVVSSLPG